MLGLFVRLVAAFVFLACSASVGSAQPVNITQDLPFFEFDNGQRFIVIEREQNNDAVIDPAFAKTSRHCPPFCIHPMQAAPGVTTIGELEVMDFLEKKVATGKGHLIDARLRNWFESGTIPGSVNLPFTMFNPGDENPFRDGMLKLLGAVQGDGGQWDFSTAKELALFCNGPWCDQSPRAIRNLIDTGYPPEKLYYYRGGMQNWLLLGLTVEVPGATG